MMKKSLQGLSDWFKLVLLLIVTFTCIFGVCFVYGKVGKYLYNFCEINEIGFSSSVEMLISFLSGIIFFFVLIRTIDICDKFFDAYVFKFEKEAIDEENASRIPVSEGKNSLEINSDEKVDHAESRSSKLENNEQKTRKISIPKLVLIWTLGAALIYLGFFLGNNFSGLESLKLFEFVGIATIISSPFFACVEKASK